MFLKSAKGFLAETAEDAEFSRILSQSAWNFHPGGCMACHIG